MKLLVAIGGNALVSPEHESGGQIDQAKIEAVAASLVALEEEHSLIITHGNGPQVGWLAMQEIEANMSLDLLDAQSEGVIGYRLAQAMDNCRQRERSLSLLTRVVVDTDDPAFSHPAKPVGPVLDESRAQRLASQQGWQFAEVAGGRRRVVASPQPVRVVESAAISQLMSAGYSVICAGGGGIPVLEQQGQSRGISAVIDKDYTSALLAAELKLDVLLLLTNVEALYDNWNQPTARAVRLAGCESLRDRGFQQGSMGPKVEAACRFVRDGGGFAGIGRLTEAQAILEERRGTRIVTDNVPVTWW
ncbi:MAG: carbamate kinase [Thiohalophilus sp.]|uniref:amino acid kinase family protein n=1 Tax=Thiohalophilus sp. TaxID=3028392 RepID=UPI00286FD8F7|nr:carbamate kinase [Thiohalophilus sp.]MDR9435632.1 carbamate kinase [Thiohalophilus sp.]